MEYTRIEEFAKIRPADTTVADLHLARCLAAAAAGETSAYFELGVAYSTGSHGVAIHLSEAYDWFNYSLYSGQREAAWCRAYFSDERTARVIAEAQSRAR